MDQLFAPWRIDWVKRESPTDGPCVFCELPEVDDEREALVLAKGRWSYLLLNNAPYNPGHVMAIPYRHVCAFEDLTDAELLEQGRLLQVAIGAIDTVMGPDGFNSGYNLGRAGGGSIRHIHAHLVPRWRGDTNFMAVIDDTKVVVQALEETYDVLLDALLAQPGATVDGDRSAVRFEFDPDLDARPDPPAGREETRESGEDAA